MDISTHSLGAASVLTEAPAEIASFAALRYLSLVGHKLTALCPPLSQLQTLTAVNLSRNALLTVPLELLTLLHLSQLELAHNLLTVAPAELCHLPLQLLDLSGNRIASVPPDLLCLSTLTALSLEGNLIQMLPDIVDPSALAPLTALDLSGNLLVSLPEYILCIPTLSHLSVSRNKLTSLPTPSAAAPTAPSDQQPQPLMLRSLELADNALTELPAAVLLMTRLVILDLARNKLRSLPEQLSASLTAIDVSSNRFGTEPPEHLWRLTLLSALNLGDNGLLNLPDRISALSGLRHLNLSGNIGYLGCCACVALVH